MELSMAAAVTTDSLPYSSAFTLVIAANSTPYSMAYSLAIVIIGYLARSAIELVPSG